MKTKFKTVNSIKAPGSRRIILTKEIRDRDGEIVSIDGLDLTNYMKNPGLFFGHKALNGTLYDMIGTVEDIKKEVDRDGLKMVTGLPRFARHQVAQDAMAMYEDGILVTGSIGFMEKGYDSETKIITESEMLEFSLVGVPSNVEASQVKQLDKLNNELATKLTNYEDIHPKIKQYRKLFLSEEFVNLFGYEKEGDELIDLKNIHDLIVKSVEEAQEEAEEVETPQEPEPEVETQPEGVSSEELKEMIDEKFIEIIRGL